MISPHANNEASDNFAKLSVEWDGYEYTKGYIDKVDAQLLAECLRIDNNQDDDFTLVAPKDPVLLLMLSILSLLEVLRYDVTQRGLQTLDNLNPGDNVGLIYERTMYPGIFQGTEIMHDRKYYVVRHADGHITEKIPEGREWRIQPYSSADVIASKRRGTIYGKALESLLGLPTGGLKAFQKSKILVVPEDKRQFIEQMRKTKLGGDLIEYVFPLAEYTSVHEWSYIGQHGANNLKQQPTVGVVASADMAVDIALKDPNVRLLLLSGSSKLRRNFGGIERLNYDETPRKIICMVDPTQEEEIKTLNALDIESWVWKRSDFNQEYQPATLPESPFFLHDSIYRMLAYSGIETVEVALPEAIEDAIKAIYRILFSLSRSVNPLPESAILIRQGIGLVNAILQLPCTIAQHDSFINGELQDGRSINDKFRHFKENLKAAHGYLIPSTHLAEAENLTLHFDRIFAYFLANSPKSDKLSELLNDNSASQSQIGIFTPTAATAAYLSKTVRVSKKTATMERLDSLPCDVAILTGWSNRKNVARTFLAPTNRLIWLLYKREISNVESVYRTHPASPRLNFDAKLRERMGYAAAIEGNSGHDAQTKVSVQENDVPSIDDLLESFSERFGELDSLYVGMEGAEQSAGTDVVDAWRVTLSEDSFVFVDAEHRLDKIDTVNNSLDRCTISELKEDDELVFAENDRDMFKELLDELKRSDTYTKLYEQATVWKDALIQYMERTNTSEGELVTMFSMLQYPKDISVIRSWIKGEVIGPSGDNYAAIPVIEKITNDERLKGKFAEIVRAIKAVHALHIKTGYLLVRSIVNASVVGVGEVDDVTRARLEKYAASARLRTITGISDYTIPMNTRYIGKLESIEL